MGVSRFASSPVVVWWDCFLGKQRGHGVGKALDFQKTLGRIPLCLEAGQPPGTPLASC